MVNTGVVCALSRHRIPKGFLVSMVVYGGKRGVEIGTTGRALFMKLIGLLIIAPSSPSRRGLNEWMFEPKN
ncbi:hypothetical protein CsSME_00030399 [Camellia sinensis var. sinensis]